MEGGRTNDTEVAVDRRYVIAHHASADDNAAASTERSLRVKRLSGRERSAPPDQTCPHEKHEASSHTATNAMPTMRIRAMIMNLSKPSISSGGGHHANADVASSETRSASVCGLATNHKRRCCGGPAVALVTALRI